jgi:hypothetical protein
VADACLASPTPRNNVHEHGWGATLQSLDDPQQFQYVNPPLALPKQLR